MGAGKSSEHDQGVSVPRCFLTTHWSVVLQASHGDSTQASQALEQLCRGYWYPLYAYVRRRGYSAAEAQDLTQEFFQRLLASNWIGRADRTKGRFRTFLLCGMENFLGNEWQKAHRLKRGGGGHAGSIGRRSG
jgi:DNA-directed RNA polymerase specialized sigma24 family protein